MRQQLRTTFTNIEQASQKVELKINKEKTKIFLVNYELSDPAPSILANLEVVEDLKYLNNIASSYKDFRQRQGIAWNQFWKLEKYVGQHRNKKTKAMSIGLLNPFNSSIRFRNMDTVTKV